MSTEKKTVLWSGTVITMPTVLGEGIAMSDTFGGRGHRKTTGKQNFISSSCVVNLKTAP